MIRRGLRIMICQKIGTSSTKHQEKTEEFTLAEFIATTKYQQCLTTNNKIGAISFGVCTVEN
jgi:hypothetical protein